MINRMFPLLLILFIAEFAFSLPGSAESLPSQWQGASYPRLSTLQTSTQAERFLVLDTGGSGGMFGQGDLRKNLLDVVFWDEHIGWACGNGGVFKTKDGGLTWQRIKPRLKPPARWRHVAMSGPQQVWLLEGFHGQAKARLWHTEDGGQTWQEALVGKLRGASDLRVYGNHIWVLAGDFPSYHSTDGGQSWQRLRFDHLLNGTVQIAIPLQFEGGIPTFYILGHQKRQPQLIKSSNVGENWQTLALPQSLPKSYWRYCVFFVSNSVGWIGLPTGQLLLTADGGQHWMHRDLPTDQAVTALWFTNSKQGFVAVANDNWRNPRQTLYETRDGGLSWIPVLGGKAHINALFGLDKQHLWAVGDVPGFAANDLVAILQPEGNVER